MNKIRKGEVKIYKGKEYIAIPEIEEESCTGCCFYDKGICLINHADDPNCLNTKIANMIVLSNLLAIFFITLYQQLSSPVKVPISVLPRLILIPAS